jgi:hypothetical protein
MRDAARHRPDRACTSASCGRRLPPMKLLAAFVFIFLTACGETDPSPAAQRSTRTRERIAKAELASRQPPRVITHRVGNGELVVLEIPVVLSSGFADVQRCFLWRDIELKTSSLHCPAESDAPPLEGGVTTDDPHP